jgi:hypothetical protein
MEEIALLFEAEQLKSERKQRVEGKREETESEREQEKWKLIPFSCSLFRSRLFS